MENKYKIHVLESSKKHMNNDLHEMQLKGWEIAGDISVKPYEGSRGFRVYIPIKLKIN